MIRNKSLILKQQGFSLVELMVVVAIIGALAMVAVPRVNRFIAKARTSEAQVNLGSIYTFNKNFLVEFTGYTNSLQAMGYNPEGQLRYNTGFIAARAAPDNYFINKGLAVGAWPPGSNASTNTKALCGAAGVPANGCLSLKGADNAVPPDLTAANVVEPAGAFQTFRAAAESILTNGGARDAWTINDTKTLTNVNDGTL